MLRWGTEMTGKKGRKPTETPTHKYSILVPLQLHEKLQKITSLRGVSLSDMVRYFLEQGVLKEFSEDGSKDIISVQLDSCLRKLLEEVGKHLRINHLESLIILCLAQYLPDMLIQARDTAKKLERIIKDESSSP